MSKAEKFIQDYTSNCSNEILSPYPQINNDIRRIGGEPAKDFSPWLTPDQALKAVEIAREEIYEWLLANADDYCFCARNFEARRCIYDIKQAIKDE